MKTFEHKKVKEAFNLILVYFSKGENKIME